MRKTQDYGGYAAKIVTVTKGRYLRHRFFRRGQVSGAALIPVAWAGRKAKGANVPAPAYGHIASVTGLHKVTVAQVLAGKVWPSSETQTQLKTVGIVVGPTYRPDRRAFSVDMNRCVVCKSKFWANQRRTRFCSNTCYMAKWHRNARRRRLCNYCGEKADSRLAFACRRHESKQRASGKRANLRARQRYIKEGLCISCGVFPAQEIRSISSKGKACVSRQKCELCRWRNQRAGAKVRERHRKEWQARQRSEPEEMLISLRKLLPAGLPEGVRDDAR